MLKSILKKIFLSAAILPLAANSESKTSYQPPTFTDDNRLQKIQKVFPLIEKMYKEHAENNHYPGYAFGIMLDGKLIYSGSGGYINIKNKIPATPQSMFRIASMTKSFTAMAILKLRDEGKLKLDDPVYLYVPEIKNQALTKDAAEITIRDLLTHSAGLPQDDPWGDRNLNKTDEELISLLKKGISFSNPGGTTYEYSNLAFAILGLIIKKVSGESYQEYIAENIWKPLKMQQITWEFGTVAADQLAHGYKKTNSDWQEEALLHDGSFGAMGGVITSIESFSRYVSFHQLAWPPRDDAEAGPLKRSSVREMHQPWRFNSLNTHNNSVGQNCATVSAYGYGIRWLQNCDAKIYIGHSGGLPGFGSNWSIMPDYGIGVILFANVTYANATDINLKVLDAVIKETHLKPRQLPVSQVLHDRQQALIKLLPDWKDAKAKDFFAANFFLDNSINELKNQTRALFAKTGKIIHVGEVIPENQLRGYFIMEGENAKLKISFTLSPQKPALIQKYQIEEMPIAPQDLAMKKTFS